MSKHAKLPWWLKSVNRVVIALNRLGLAVGTQRMLSIPSRKTGKLRSTPVSLLTVNGQRYIVTGLETDWVKNARVALPSFRSRCVPPSYANSHVRCHTASRSSSGCSAYRTIQRRSRRQYHSARCSVWRRFTKGMRKEQARANTTIEGDEKLGEKMLDTVSIIA